jgi:branched-chain amino acid transport system permease protein
VIFSIFSLSLNLEYGYTGLVNFGKAGFFLIGAYSVAIIMGYYRGAFAWTGNAVLGSFIFGVIVGILICAFVGAVLSAIGTRLREDYFGILTLVFAEILRQGIQDTQVSSIFGGPDGINGLPPIVPTAIYTNLVANSVAMLLISSFVLAVVYVITWRITNSPFGRTMRGIRDDELATQSLGKNSLWFKIQVMMVGSGITAIAGAVYTVWILGTNPNFFLPAITFQMFIISIMGGSSSLKGPILGSALYYLIQRAADLLKGTTFTLKFFQFTFHFGLNATQAPDLQYIITGVLLIVFVILRPQGIITEGAIRAGKIST